MGWSLENALWLPWDSRGVRVVEEIEAGAEVSWGRMEKLRQLGKKQRMWELMKRLKSEEKRNEEE